MNQENNCGSCDTGLGVGMNTYGAGHRCSCCQQSGSCTNTAVDATVQISTKLYYQTKIYLWHNFEIKFKIKPIGVRNGLTNIIHLTKTDNDCCYPGDRMAAV
jgi:hypothetical protein